MPKVDVPRPKTLRGMDATRRADLLSPEQWRYQFTMRLKETKLTQVPRKVFKYGLYQQEPVLHVDVLPGFVPGYGKAVALTKSSLFRLGDSSGTSIATNFNTSSEFLRWATFKYGGRLYFVNAANSVAWTDGVSYESLGDTPRGYHIGVDNFHLLVGSFEWKGRTHRNGIAWSHPHKFSSFESASSLEGDYRVLEEYHRDGETVEGVTGIAVMGDVTLVLSSSVIYALRYVEGQKTYRVDPVLYDKGCGLLYGMAQIGHAVVFPDVVEKNFYLYQGPGSQAEEVGDAIKDFFFSDLNPAPELAQRTYVETDLENKELRWVYVSSASAGDYDRAVVLSLRDRGWSYRVIEATNCFTPGIRLARKCSELSGINSALSGSNLAQGRTSTVLPALYGTKDGMLLRDEVSGDALSVLVEQTLPFLETSDFAYDDLTRIKELDGIVIHANWTNANYLKVEVAARNNLSEALVWVQYGTWDKTHALLRVSEPRVSGRILRFRFTPVTTGAAAASQKDFSSGATVLPTPSATYNSFRLWDVYATVQSTVPGSPIYNINTVSLNGSNANGTYRDEIPGNGVYVQLFYQVVLSIQDFARMTTKALYTLSSAKTYRVTMRMSGPGAGTGSATWITFRWGSVTKTWQHTVDVPAAFGFANYTYDFTPAASGSNVFSFEAGETAGSVARSLIVDRFTVVEIAGGSATIIDDDFELEQEAAGFVSSLNEGGGVRGFVFDAFAEKIRGIGTQVDR